MRIVIVGVLLAACGIGTADAKARQSAPALRGERLYVAQIADKEKSEEDDRLIPARLVHAIKVVDIDHDGIPDYVVDYNKVVNTHWCGTGGCNFEIWHGKKGGHPVRVWNVMARQYTIAQRNGETVFDFDFHGGNCGTFGASACPASFGWNGMSRGMEERPTPSGNTIVRLIDPIPLTRADVPANILAMSLAASAKCKADYSSDDVSLPASIPDIDGDGLRDWSLTIAACDKTGGNELQQILFVTAGNANNPIIAASGAFFSLSFGTKPVSVARVNETETCGGFKVDAKMCTATPMIWNAATKKLEIVAQ